MIGPPPLGDAAIGCLAELSEAETESVGFCESVMRLSIRVKQKGNRIRRRHSPNRLSVPMESQHSRVIAVLQCRIAARVLFSRYLTRWFSYQDGCDILSGKEPFAGDRPRKSPKADTFGFKSRIIRGKTCG